MNRVKNIIALFAFSLLILGLPSLVSAQWRDRDNNRDDDTYNRNDDYNRNNRNNRNSNDDYNRNNRNGNYNRNLNSTIKNLKNRSNQFEKKVDRELDRSRYDDRRREDSLNNLAQRFADAADNLDDVYDNDRDFNRSANQAQQVLSLGNQLERALSRTQLGGNIQNDWSRIQQDLNVLANAYGYNYNNNNNRNNRNNRNTRSNGSWRNQIPFPLPF